MAEIGIDGLKELNIKLGKLGNALAVKSLRKALRKAGTPTLAQMRAAAPVGKTAHRTYKKRLVTPGFLKRSIRMIVAVNKRNGAASVVFGVRREAFYGIQFLDARAFIGGGYVVTQRRFGGNGRRGRKRTRLSRDVKPYTIRATPWFSSVFTANSQKMVNDFRDALRVEVEGAVRG